MWTSSREDWAKAITTVTFTFSSSVKAGISIPSDSQLNVLTFSNSDQMGFSVYGMNLFLLVLMQLWLMMRKQAISSASNPHDLLKHSIMCSYLLGWSYSLTGRRYFCHSTYNISPNLTPSKSIGNLWQIISTFLNGLLLKSIWERQRKAIARQKQLPSPLIFLYDGYFLETYLMKLPTSSLGQSTASSLIDSTLLTFTFTGLQLKNSSIGVM